MPYDLGRGTPAGQQVNVRGCMAGPTNSVAFLLVIPYLMPRFDRRLKQLTGFRFMELGF